jgi:hypothetical protein
MSNTTTTTTISFPFIMPDSHPDLFPYVLIVMSLICFECVLVSFFITVPARMRAFNKDYLR